MLKRLIKKKALFGIGVFFCLCMVGCSSPVSSGKGAIFIPGYHSKQPKYNLRKELAAVSKNDLRLDGNFRPTEFVQNDFRDNGDGTVSDHATGLMWKKSRSDKKYTFDRTEEYVQNLNREKFAGYSNWRVPTIEELMSLITQNKQSDGRYINPIFDMQADVCWSATTNADDTPLAWVVALYDGDVGYGFKTGDYYVWPVRSISP